MEPLYRGLDNYSIIVIIIRTIYARIYVGPETLLILMILAILMNRRDQL